MQWLGGIGIIVMATTVLPLLKVGGMQLFKTDSSGTEKILPKTIEVATTIISIYLTLTFFCGFSYWSQGMNVFDSIAHSMTTLATGGFSTQDGYLSSSSFPSSLSLHIARGFAHGSLGRCLWPFISFLIHFIHKKTQAQGLGPFGFHS